MSFLRKLFSHRRISKTAVLLFIGLIVLSGRPVAGHMWPALGGWTADALRGLLGDPAVASLETFVFQKEDALHQILPSLLSSQSTAASQSPSSIQDARGQTVAEQSYLYPDPRRPYAQAFVIAFNLNRVRLHFALGTDELQSSTPVPSGRLPEDDLRSGLLVAIFNGGFKARHGHFGIAVNGQDVIPMREGLGTLGIYADGRVQLGQWGTEIMPAPNLVAARQNGLLIIHQGEINPRLALDDVREWGYIVKNNTPTWRSGVGLSAERDTLYYAAGPSLTLSALAEALRAAGAAQAIQLDVNQADVYYGTIRKVDSTLQVIPAFESMPLPDDLIDYHFSRDFFYVTSVPD